MSGDVTTEHWKKRPKKMATLRVAAETGHLQRYSSIKYPDILNPRALQLARFRRDRRQF